MSAPKVLVVDDEKDMRWVLRGLLTDAGFAVSEAGNGREALDLLGSTSPDVLLTDVRMPEMNGIELMREVQRRSRNLPIVMISAVEDVATAVEAVKAGAYDWHKKPLDSERLVLTLRRAAEQFALKREVEDLRNRSRSRVGFGTSEAARSLEAAIEKISPLRDLGVLVVGESGTGKEIVAREIHRRSPLAEGPFVPVDCGALPETLLESHLFGHRKGAFTGAIADRPGLFVLADRGTLFLDEIGNLPLVLQAKLLRALQERAVTPVGGDRPIPFRARLLCATNDDIEAAVRDGRFRLDLYHRIAEFVLKLPPLRERQNDIIHFARLFLAEANEEMGRRVQGIGPSAEAELRRHPWPGNLRELRNAIRRAVVMCTGTELEASDLLVPAAPAPPPSSPSSDSAEASLPLAERVRRAADAIEARILAEALEKAGGNKAAAARALQIDYTTLHRKVKRHGIRGDD
ncbi:MAG: sigma 54-interacting transcriptional regulator [Planctomycetota bacterium]